MRKVALATLALSLIAGIPQIAQAKTPAQDLKDFRAYYMKRFPGIPLNDFQNGVYAINSDAREAWENIEEFPPWEEGFEIGENFFKTKFKNGKSLASCFSNGGNGIRQNYPMFDKQSGTIKTLEGEINACLKKNGEKTLKWKRVSLRRFLHIWLQHLMVKGSTSKYQTIRERKLSTLEASNTSMPSVVS